MLRLLNCSAATAGAVYDVAIVGSGISGCVAARRILAQRPGARVAMIEEGSLPATGIVAESPFFSSYLAKMPWTRHMCAPYGAQHGRVVGGACAVAEGPWVVRGLGEEYEAIASAYGSDSIRKFDAYYGDTMAEAIPSNRSTAASASAAAKGRVTVSYPSLRQLNSDMNAKFQQSCFASSLRAITEEGGDSDGFGPVRSLVSKGRRFRPTDMLQDLSVDLYTNTFAKSLAFDKAGRDGKVTGLSVCPANAKTGPAQVIAAANVLLCAGGVGTPSLLLRSGVGPAELLGGRLACRKDVPALGQSVIEAPRMHINFGTRVRGVTNTVCGGRVGALLSEWRQYRADREGPFASFAEWQAFVCSSDAVHRPDARLTFITALDGGLPVAGQNEGFTVAVDLTGTTARGKIVPVAVNSVATVPNEDRAIEYQYSYASDATLKAMDDAVLWATTLCDSSSSVTYFVNGAHPFAEFETRALHPELEAPETSRELFRATAVGSGDVYGACPMGEVCDPNTLKIHGMLNVSIGDVSVIPTPMLANKFALGQVTACMAVDGL